MARLHLLTKYMWAALGIALLWWLYRSQPDTVGEMVVEMDDIDSDDPGKDVDDDEVL